MDRMNQEETDKEKRAKLEAATVEAVAYLRASGCPFPVGAKPGIVAANWMIAFGDSPPEDFGIAVGMHVQGERAQFWPTPFELRSYVAPPDEDWGALFAEVMRLRGLDTLEVSEAVRVVVFGWVKAQGGSKVIGMWQTADLPYRKREFIEYMTKAARNAEMAARRAQVSAAGPKLIGGGS